MKFNQNSKGKDRMINYEGGEAYRLTPEWQLYVMTVTSSLSNTFYENVGDRLTVMRELIAKNDPQFVAQLAIYARDVMNLRSVPLVLAVELARVHRGDSTVRRLVSRVIQRADEITELLAYYQLANNRTSVKKLNKLSKQLQAGLQEAFNRFDEYQFAKYNRDAEIKLQDALFLVHPKAKDEAQQKLFDKLVNDTLETPYTWETELSNLGQQSFTTAEDKEVAFKHKWEDLLDSGKLGYMALLRNLRNILQANVSEEHIDQVCERLADADAVSRSKQLPFRFLAAYRELSKEKSGETGCVMQALEEAVAVAAQAIQGFDRSTSVLLACDVSGSMQQPISPRSKVLCYDIGLMLAMLLNARCEKAITGMFGDSWKIIQVPTKGVLSNVDAFYRREGEVGYATNGYLVIKDLIKRREVIDKVMLFTDCQLWNTQSNQTMAKLWTQYKQIAPNSKLYLFDLVGYGVVPVDIKRDDVYLIGGWSDKVFDILEAIDEGGDTLDIIKKITF